MTPKPVRVRVNLIPVKAQIPKVMAIGSKWETLPAMTPVDLPTCKAKTEGVFCYPVDWDRLKDSIYP